MPRSSRDSISAAPPLTLEAGPDLKTRMTALGNLQNQLARLTDDGDTIDFEQLRAWKSLTHKKKETWSIQEELSPDFIHGGYRFEANRTFSTEALEALTGDTRLKGFEIGDALFLDIEATGLSHGAGTCAFVIGLGWFNSGGNYCFEQIVLKDPSGERAQLLALKERLKSKKFLVSFNGKSYDLSVLQSRMVMHRLYSFEDSELKLTPHVDLLHLYRAIWKKSLPNCKLQTLEKEILGWKRVNDVPGSIVPSLYFAYLQSGDARTLDPVLTHNRWDILSMVSLLFALVAEVEKPSEIGSSKRLVQLGNLFTRRGQFPRAKQVVDVLLSRALHDEELLQPLELGIRVFRRLKHYHLLYPLLHTYTTRFPDLAFGWVERSKYEEHRLKDYAEAYQSAKRALSLSPCPEPSLLKRAERLSARTSTIRSPSVELF